MCLPRSQLLSLEEVETKEQEILDKEEAERAEAELHAESFVEFLGGNHLFEMMFQNDVDGKTLLKIGDDAVELFDEFEQEFTTLCKQVFEIGQEQYRLRKNEIEQFTKNCDNALLKAQQESIVRFVLFRLLKQPILCFFF